MNLRLFLLERYVPVAVRRQMLGQLVRATADAFGVPPPRMPQVCDDTFVQAYAQFTRWQVDRVGAGGQVGAAVRDRLYTGGYGIGRSVRRRAGIRTAEESVRALRLIYGAIGIDLHANPATRAVTVRRCAFSDVYTPAMCHFVSALDAGLFHGVSGTWSVAFTERITDGAHTCRGRLTEVSRP